MSPVLRSMVFCSLLLTVSLAVTVGSSAGGSSNITIIIAAAVAGGVVLIIALIVIVLCVRRRRNNNSGNSEVELTPTAQHANDTSHDTYGPSTFLCGIDLTCVLC